MPRPLVALAVMFALVIGAAAVLLYRADRQKVPEIAERTAAPPAEELPVEAPQSAPAEIAETEEAPVLPMEQLQVAEPTVPPAAEEFLPPLEITDVEAASQSATPTAEAAIEAFDLTGLAVAGVEAQAQGFALYAPVVEASAPVMRYPEGVVLEPIVTATSGDSPLIADAALSPAPSYVIIRRGDNLWRIAERNYGSGIRYQAILAANQDQIRNPRWIFPGQVLVIPTRDRSWEPVEP